MVMITVKKGKIIGVLAISAFMLTGCIDNMPDMTEEQSELIAEYAADLLLKYSPNYNYRIADETKVEEALAELESTQEETAAQEETTQETAGENEQSAADTEKTADDQTAADASQEQLEDGAEYDLAAIFGFDQLSIRYQSYEVTDSYPKADSGSGFSVTAPNGHNLLILHFNIENTGEEAAECDLFDSISRIRVNVNDAGYVQALSTLLTNDMTTYMEEIPAGETQDVIVAVSVTQETAEEIETLAMRVTTADSVTSIGLK